MHTETLRRVFTLFVTYTTWYSPRYSWCFYFSSWRDMFDINRKFPPSRFWFLPLFPKHALFVHHFALLLGRYRMLAGLRGGRDHPDRLRCYRRMHGGYCLAATPQSMMLMLEALTRVGCSQHVAYALVVKIADSLTSFAPRTCCLSPDRYDSTRRV